MIFQCFNQLPTYLRKEIKLTKRVTHGDTVYSIMPPMYSSFEASKMGSYLNDQIMFQS